VCRIIIINYTIGNSDSGILKPPKLNPMYITAEGMRIQNMY